MEAYRTLTAIRKDVDISLSDYSGGYALYVLNVDENVDVNTKRRGDYRLEVRLRGTALSKSVTLLMYGKFRSMFRIGFSLDCFSFSRDWTE